MKDRFPNKKGICRICNSMGDTDWHHLISQNRCKNIGKPEWIHNRGNIVELCRSCHDETTATLVRKQLTLCRAKTKAGNPCKMYPIKGTNYCKYHKWRN